MSQGGYLFRYDLDTGENRLIRPAPHAAGIDLRFNWDAAIAQDPFDPATIYYGSQFVHKSTDRGTTWTVISPDLTSNDSNMQNFRTSGGLTSDVTSAENYTTIVAIGASPLEQGLLTGKYKPGQPLPDSSRASDERQNEFIIDLATDQRTLEHVDRLHEVAEDVGCTLGQLALAWILSHPEITSCIVGATRSAQIEENAGASGIELSESQLARIDEIIMPVTFSHDY